MALIHETNPNIKKRNAMINIPFIDSLTLNVPASTVLGELAMVYFGIVIIK